MLTFLRSRASDRKLRLAPGSARGGRGAYGEAGVNNPLAAHPWHGVAVVESEREPPTWGRPHFQPGGGDALAAFLVFGHVGDALTLSRTRHRLEPLPDGVTVLRHDRAEHPDVFDLLTGDVGDVLRAEHPDVHERALHASTCVRVQGRVPDPATLDYLRATVGVVTAVADQGGVAVLDMPALRWRSPAAWRSEFADKSSFAAGSHVTLFVSEEERGPGRWFHTRGMRKFGRPDVSVRDVPEGAVDGAIGLCNRLIEMMALGAIIPEGQAVRMRGLPEGMVCRHAGSLDDPDFNNVHVEVRYPAPSAV
jgi:hypothetical protein